MKTPEETAGGVTMEYEKAAMQRRIDNLMEQLELVKLQRDAALSDLAKARDCCHFCKHDAVYTSTCDECKHGSNFEWRGAQENGGAEDA